MAKINLKNRVLIDARNKVFQKSCLSKSLLNEFYAGVCNGSIYLIDKSTKEFAKKELLEFGAKPLDSFSDYLFLDFEKNHQRVVYEPIDFKKDKYGIRNVISLD